MAISRSRKLNYIIKIFIFTKLLKSNEILPSPRIIYGSFFIIIADGLDYQGSVIWNWNKKI